MDIRETFADKLKELRTKKKLSQTELAEKLGVSRGSISFYENGERTADIDFVYKAAQFFNVSADYLLGRTEAETMDPNLGAAQEYTGLSEEAVTMLHVTKELEKGYYILFDYKLPPEEYGLHAYEGFHERLSEFVTTVYPQISNLITRLNTQLKLACTELEREIGAMKEGQQLFLSEVMGEAQEYQKNKDDKIKNTRAEQLYLDARHTFHDVQDVFSDYIKATCPQYNDTEEAKREHMHEKLNSELRMVTDESVFNTVDSGEKNNGNDN